MKSLADSLADSPAGSPAKSLADSLGLSTNGEGLASAKDARTARRLSAKQFARLVLESPEYREHVWRMVRFDNLSPALETLLFHYAYGKPVDRLEIEDVTVPLESQSAEQLEHRALFLAEKARKLRMNVDAPADSDEDDGGTSAVH